MVYIVKHEAHDIIKNVQENHCPLQRIKNPRQEQAEQKNHPDIQQHVIPFHLKEFRISDILDLKKEIPCIQQYRKQQLRVQQYRLFPFLRRPGKSCKGYSPGRKAENNHPSENRQIQLPVFLRCPDDQFSLKKKKAQSNAPVQDPSCAGSPGLPPCFQFFIQSHHIPSYSFMSEQ